MRVEGGVEVEVKREGEVGFEVGEGFFDEGECGLLDGVVDLGG